LHEAGHLLVACVTGLPVQCATLSPDSPDGEVVLGRLADAVLDPAANLTEEDRASLSPLALNVTAALLGGGVGEAIAAGVVPSGAGYDMMRARFVAEFFWGSRAPGKLEAAFQRAATVISEGRPALDRLASLLITSNGIPGEVASGIVAGILGPRLELLRESLRIQPVGALR
jgi:hypothetical protein